MAGKAIYKLMFVEVLRGKEWVRQFPRTKSQIEWIDFTTVYRRGMGGGYPLFAVRKDMEWMYFSKKKGEGSDHRVALKDWQALQEKSGNYGL